MRKLTMLLVALGLILTIGCMAKVHDVKEGGLDIKNYDRLIFSSISADKFWSDNPKLKENEKWEYQVNRASDLIQKTVSEYYDKKWGTSGKREMKVEADLFMLKPGQRALRYFVGFGAGKGKIGYHVKLFDGKTNDLISEFDAYGTMVGGFFGGDIKSAYEQCSNAIIKFINAKHK